jgi:hypothetical protein
MILGKDEWLGKKFLHLYRPAQYMDGLYFCIDLFGSNSPPNIPTFFVPLPFK